MVVGGGRSKEGATAARADERSSFLIDGMRRKEEVTTKAHNQIVIWADRPPL